MGDTIENTFLEIDKLVAPIAGETPRGDEHVYSRQLREQLVSLRKPEEPGDGDDTSYRRSADWDAIIELGCEALLTQTKDLRIACHLLEAETQLNGFAGLYSGLQFLTTFVSECWDRCNPSIDDGDLEVRTAPLENMLDDAQRGVCFPTTVRQIPLLGSPEKSCSLLEYQSLKQSSDSDATRNLATIIESTNPAAFTQLALDVDSSLEQLESLKTKLNENWAKRLRDSLTFAQQFKTVSDWSKSSCRSLSSWTLAATTNLKIQKTAKLTQMSNHPIRQPMQLSEQHERASNLAPTLIGS